ncbi:Hypothetical predicted protein [Podarcis lilfordi]|uniref:Uncharacterized protein n=1 Tax=Podarcis lilfordi TaxID=74358 RepID=A0AA35PHN6_9SAUR|nr:Hypothetical predicted protein [Podarcis lilfordi]
MLRLLQVERFQVVFCGDPEVPQMRKMMSRACAEAANRDPRRCVLRSAHDANGPPERIPFASRGTTVSIWTDCLNQIPPSQVPKRNPWQTPVLSSWLRSLKSNPQSKLQQTHSTILHMLTPRVVQLMVKLTHRRMDCSLKSLLPLCSSEGLTRERGGGNARMRHLEGDLNTGGHLKPQLLYEL